MPKHAKTSRTDAKEDSYCDVDARAIKKYWQSLASEAKHVALRLEDAEIATRLYDMQQSLFAADFECFMIGVRNQHDVRRMAGSDNFDVEGIIGEGGSLHPKAFFVKPGFAESADFFELLENWMGRTLFQPGLVLPRRRWRQSLKTTPSSWSEFVRLVAKLIESVLCECCQAASTPSTIVEAAQVEAAERIAEELECTEELGSGPGSPSKSAKRRARMKRTAATAKALDVADVDAGNESEERMAMYWQHESSDPSSAKEPASIQQQDSSLAVERKSSGASSGAQYFTIRSIDSPWQLPTYQEDDDAEDIVHPFIQEEHQYPSMCAGSSSDPIGASFAHQDADPDSLLSTSQHARQSACDWRITADISPALTASQASMASAREARINAELQARSTRGRSWPAWLLVDGSSGENWVDGFRTTVKYTFVDLEEIPIWTESECSAVRAHSQP